MPHLRKTAEIVMALYVSMFGGFVAFFAISGVNTLDWSGLDINEASRFAWLCLTSATIHAVGIWLNGSVRWSPYIRVAGILFGAALFFCLAWLGSVVQNTAGYTYLWVALGFIAALRTAVIDCILSWRGLYGSVH